MKNDSTTILAVESSTKACSVSLLYKQKNYSQFEIAPQQHANLMLIMVEKVLKMANIQAQQIDTLALCEGPGAFTGVRIATGVIQGLAYGWNKPVISISSLETLAWQMHQQTQHTSIIACLDARMQEIYLQSCQIINGKLHSSPPQLLSAEKAIIFIKQSKIKNGIGDIKAEFSQVSNIFNNWQTAYPNAQYVTQVANQRLTEAKTIQEHLPQPIYLRNNIAIKKATIT